MGQRLTGGMVALVATGAGNGGAVANALTAWTLSAGKRAIIRKITWRNRTGANANLLIGFGDRTAVGSLFRQVLPTILMINGIDGELSEDLLPICGNTPQGFQADTTVPTGTVGNILVETDSVLVAPPPATTDIQVIIEVEEE